jgi:hypothetical protein
MSKTSDVWEEASISSAADDSDEDDASITLSEHSDSDSDEDQTPAAAPPPEAAPPTKPKKSKKVSKSAEAAIKFVAFDDGAELSGYELTHAVQTEHDTYPPGANELYSVVRHIGSGNKYRALLTKSTARVLTTLANDRAALEKSVGDFQYKESKTTSQTALQLNRTGYKSIADARSAVLKHYRYHQGAQIFMSDEYAKMLLSQKVTRGPKDANGGGPARKRARTGPSRPPSPAAVSPVASRPDLFMHAVSRDPGAPVAEAKSFVDHMFLALFKAAKEFTA